MTETKTKFNWDKLAEKGDSYDEIRIGFNALEFHCCELQKEEIYNENNAFKEEFKQDLENKLAQIFESSPLTKKERNSMKKKFINDLEKILDLVVLKKAFAQITFSQFHLFKLFEALDSFVNEIEIEVLKGIIKINTSDPSRIGLIEFIFDNDSFQFFRAGKMGINVKDFKDLLKCNATDGSKVSLLFTEKELVMNISSKKRKRTIERTLSSLNLELHEMSMETLNKIKHPFEFEMTKDDFVDLMGNSGRYSEILEIKTTPKEVIFSESSNKGTSIIGYEEKDLVSLRFTAENLLLESKREDDRELVIRDTKIFEEKQCTGSYSLTFLSLIKSFSLILDAQDRITFSLKDDHPLKTQIKFKKLKNAKLTYYLAPRVSEAEFEEDDFDEAEE